MTTFNIPAKAGTPNALSCSFMLIIIILSLNANIQKALI
jgi:hypothetical protein